MKLNNRKLISRQTLSLLFSLVCMVLTVGLSSYTFFFSRRLTQVENSFFTTATQIKSIRLLTDDIVTNYTQGQHLVQLESETNLRRRVLPFEDELNESDQDSTQSKDQPPIEPYSPHSEPLKGSDSLQKSEIPKDTPTTTIPVFVTKPRLIPAIYQTRVHKNINALIAGIGKGQAEIKPSDRPNYISDDTAIQIARILRTNYTTEVNIKQLSIDQRIAIEKLVSKIVSNGGLQQKTPYKELSEIPAANSDDSITYLLARYIYETLEKTKSARPLSEVSANSSVAYPK